MIRLVSTIMIVLLFPITAISQDIPISTGDADPVEQQSQAASSAAFSENLTYKQALNRAHALYSEGHLEEALVQYQAARKLDRQKPIVLYFIASTQAKLKRYEEGIATLGTLVALSKDTNPNMCGRALFMVAVLADRRGRDDEAVEAWKAYKSFVQMNPKVNAFVDTADQQLTFYQEKFEMAVKYATVRERILKESEETEGLQQRD